MLWVVERKVNAAAFATIIQLSAPALEVSLAAAQRHGAALGYWKLGFGGCSARSFLFSSFCFSEGG
jgi:hypothetical protein